MLFPTLIALQGPHLSRLVEYSCGDTRVLMLAVTCKTLRQLLASSDTPIGAVLWAKLMRLCFVRPSVEAITARLVACYGDFPHFRSRGIDVYSGPLEMMDALWRRERDDMAIGAWGYESWEEIAAELSRSSFLKPSFMLCPPPPPRRHLHAYSGCACLYDIVEHIAHKRIQHVHACFFGGHVALSQLVRESALRLLDVHCTADDALDSLPSSQPEWKPIHFARWKLNVAVLLAIVKGCAVTLKFRQTKRARYYTCNVRRKSQLALATELRAIAESVAFDCKFPAFDPPNHRRQVLRMVWEESFVLRNLLQKFHRHATADIGTPHWAAFPEWIAWVEMLNVANDPSTR